MEIDDITIQNDQPQLLPVQPKMKKCHGNRNDQRFRKKFVHMVWMKVNLNDYLKKENN